MNLGFLISERILNMPPQISVPMYETLQKELRKAVAKNLPFDFTHFVMISRQVILSRLFRGVSYESYILTAYKKAFYNFIFIYISSYFHVIFRFCF